MSLSDARSLIFFVAHRNPHRVVVSRVAKTTSALVTVRGHGTNGYSGKPAKGRLTAPKAKRDRGRTLPAFGA